MTSIFAKEIWACPYCHNPINDSMVCSPCNESFAVTGNQPDLRIKRPIQLSTTYPYTPEFGYFPWDSISLEWPDVNNGLNISSREGTTERLMLTSVEKADSAERLVLDIGCGLERQRFQEGLRKLGYTTVGVDIDGPAPDALADAHCLPFQNEMFDVIMTSAVFEHLKNPFVAIAELYRVAKPGAKIFMSIAYNEPFHISYFHHSPLAVHELFVTAGLVPETFILSEKWHTFNSNLHMGFAGTRMPQFLQKMASNFFVEYSLMPARVKSMLKNDKDALTRAKTAFARSHSGSVGVIAHKPVNA